MSATLKIVFGEEIRRIILETISIRDLFQQLTSIFSIDPKSISLTYVDSDNDVITLSTDNELKHAIEIAGSSLRLILKANVLVKNKDKSKSVVQPVPDSVPVPNTTTTAPQSSNNVVIPATAETIVVHHAPKCLKKQQLQEMIKTWRCSLKKVHQQDATDWKERMAKFGKAVIRASPGSQLVQKLTLRNESSLNWPVGSGIAFKRGDRMNAPEKIVFDSVVENGKEIQVKIPFVAPTQVGRYVCVYRLNDHEGNIFARPIKFVVVVAAAVSQTNNNNNNQSATLKMDIHGTVEQRKRKEQKREDSVNDTQFIQMCEKLRAMGFQDQKLNAKVIRKTEGNFELAIAKLLKRTLKRQNC